MSGESEVAQRQDTLNRYLLYFPRSKNVISDVHSFTGKEILSEPYRYTIRFTSPDLNIAINAVLNQRAEFILRAPNLEASWHGQTSWLPVRQINGTITQFSRLMSSGDEALYEWASRSGLSPGLNRNTLRLSFLCLQLFCPSVLYRC